MDLVIDLDRAAPLPLYQQLAEALRQAVLQGRLQPQQTLPPSRVLAQSLGISRATVTQSYDQLLSEGYFEARRGAGTFVCGQLPEDYLQLDTVAASPPEPSTLNSLSRFGANLLTVNRFNVPDPEEPISFRVGSPTVEQFPLKLWRQLLARHCTNFQGFSGYQRDAAGHFPLRRAIADYLGRSRAVNCTAEQVIILNGSQQALNLIAQLTIDGGDWVAVEEPGYLGARRCFQTQGAQLQPVTVDGSGLNVDSLAQYTQPFKLLYVTPSHQFPTGVTLSLARRLALLQWAQITGTMIIEDDYDSEYRYGDRPIPALQGLDQQGSVIYVGTFSKIMFPALRLGYAVVPPAWIPLVSRAKWLCDRQSPLWEQYALTDYITEGHFERHIRRMRQLYDQRRQVLVNALTNHLGSWVMILGEKAGIHLMAKIETDLTDAIIIARAKARGVGLVSAKNYYLDTPRSGELIFGYAQLNAAEIEHGIQVLAQVM